MLFKLFKTWFWKVFLVRSKVVHCFIGLKKKLALVPVIMLDNVYNSTVIKRKWFFIKAKKRAELIMAERENTELQIALILNLSSLGTWINFTSGWYLGGSPKCNIQFNLAPNNTITSANCKALLKRKCLMTQKVYPYFLFDYYKINF